MISFIFGLAKVQYIEKASPVSVRANATHHDLEREDILESFPIFNAFSVLFSGPS
jgi:hypothetical protein